MIYLVRYSIKYANDIIFGLLLNRTVSMNTLFVAYNFIGILCDLLP